MKKYVTIHNSINYLEDLKKQCVASKHQIQNLKELKELLVIAEKYEVIAENIKQINNKLSD